MPIEGNTLTLQETALILKEGITIDRKPLKDHLEAVGHKEAWLYVEELVKNKVQISEKLLRKSIVWSYWGNIFSKNLEGILKLSRTLRNVIRYFIESLLQIYPGGKVVDYAYNAVNQLVRVTDWSNRITEYEYDANGRLT